jgi:membrane associated rhomboid family serine protease
MTHLTPLRLIWLGFFLLVLGFILPFLMVLHLLESTLWLNFVAYLASFFGLLGGLVGVVMYGQAHRKNRDDTE